MKLTYFANDFCHFGLVVRLLLHRYCWCHLILSLQALVEQVRKIEFHQNQNSKYLIELSIKSQSENFDTCFEFAWVLNIHCLTNINLIPAAVASTWEVWINFLVTIACFFPSNSSTAFKLEKILYSRYFIITIMTKLLIRNYKFMNEQ